ncbi:unnamed protein product [Closterium sp. NIES-54]
MMLRCPTAVEALIVTRTLIVSHSAPVSRHTARMHPPLAACTAALSLPLAPRASPSLHLLPSHTALQVTAHQVTAHQVTALPCPHTIHNQHTTRHTQLACTFHPPLTQHTHCLRQKPARPPHTLQCRSSSKRASLPPAACLSATRSPPHPLRPAVCAPRSRQGRGMAGSAAGTADSAAAGGPAGASGAEGIEGTVAQGTAEGGATGAQEKSGTGEGALQESGEGQGQAQGEGEGGEAGGAGKEEDPLVQHVVIRRDLIEALQWPLGSVITQGCHASVAVLWQHRDHPNVLKYCGQLDSMRKVGAVMPCGKG